MKISYASALILPVNLGLTVLVSGSFRFEEEDLRRSLYFAAFERLEFSKLALFWRL